MTEEPRVKVDDEDIVGCLATDQSDGEKSASERDALEEENRLAEEYQDVEPVSEEATNADVVADGALTNQDYTEETE